jgi:Flp pilus assembly protein TadD
MTMAEVNMLERAYSAVRAGRASEAERILLDGVAQIPTCGEAWFGLGTFALQTGRSDLACKRLEKAFQLNPKDWRALTLLARALRDTGRTYQAVELAERALLERPQDPEVRLCLAQCLVDTGRMFEADDVFGQLRQEFPNVPLYAYLHSQLVFGMGRDVRALRAAEECVGAEPSAVHLKNLIGVQMRLYRFEEALATSEVLLAAGEDPSAGRLPHAVSLTCLGRFEEAEPSWELAVAASPNPDVVHLQRGYSLRQWGKFVEAEGQYLKSIAIRPKQGKAFQAIFSSRKVSTADRDLIDLAADALASAPAIAPIERQYLHFGLGKAYDDLGDYARAIGHFDEANLLTREIIFRDKPYDRSVIGSAIEQNAKLFDEEFVREQSSQGSQSQLPVFVLGMMRSGTTLVEQILSAHPEIEGSGEQPYWSRMAGKFLEPDTGCLRWPELSAAVSEYEEILRTIAPKARRVVDKNPANLVNAGLLHAAFPRAKIVYVRRSNIDVAVSIWTTLITTDAPFIGHREGIVETIRQTEQMYAHWKTVLPPECMLEVNYEDLVRDLEPSARRLIAFCGLDWTDTCLHPEDNSRIVRTPSLAQVRQKVTANSVDRYRNYEPWLGPFAQLVGS